MYTYIARQPIFNMNRELKGYELLYRDGMSGNACNATDGDEATRSVLSNAVTMFGLSNLTNKVQAYINFTQNLILNDFAYLVRPQEVVVELLEDISVDERLLAKLRELKGAGYTLALDDYAGNTRFDSALPLMDIVKVDFRLTNRRQQQRLAKKLKSIPVTLLAEKVETAEDFEAAVSMGYGLFQGYFFEKPRVFNKRVPNLAKSSYGCIFNELQKKEVDFDRCAQIVHSDASMTYMVMQKINTLSYYRGNMIEGIKRALVMLGIEDLRRYVILLLSRRYNVTQSDELVRQAYLRGVFAERLMELSTAGMNSEQGFLMGMFSLLDKIMGARMEEVLKDITMNREIKNALLGQTMENRFAIFLQYIMIYEMANPRLLLPDIGLSMSGDQVAELYMACIVETDNIFGELGL